jgi:hypothetical protein
MDLVILEVVGVALSVALVVLVVVTLVEVEAHNLLGEVLKNHLTHSPDRN